MNVNNSSRRLANESWITHQRIRDAASRIQSVCAQSHIGPKLREQILADFAYISAQLELIHRFELEKEKLEGKRGDDNQ